MSASLERTTDNNARNGKSFATTVYRNDSNPRACSIVERAMSFSPSSVALLTGCPIAANANPGIPSTRLMSSAALTNRVVITATAGTPSRSATMESCRLHDEQLPQSPMPVTTASQFVISPTMYPSAGAL